MRVLICLTAPPFLLNQIPIRMTLVCVPIDHEGQIAFAICIKSINRKTVICYEIKCINRTQPNDVFKIIQHVRKVNFAAINLNFDT